MHWREHYARTPEAQFVNQRTREEPMRSDRVSSLALAAVVLAVGTLATMMLGPALE